MEETQARAAELNTMAEGKHHIGDFLPPDELARFMEKVSSYFTFYSRTITHLLSFSIFSTHDIGFAFTGISRHTIAIGS